MPQPAARPNELVSDRRDVPFTYKGETTTILAVTGDFCPACAESVLDMAQARHFGDQVSDFIKQVNASTVDPAFIVHIRKKLALDQREAAAIFGGGVNALSRYENCSVVT